MTEVKSKKKTEEKGEEGNGKQKKESKSKSWRKAICRCDHHINVLGGTDEEKDPFQLGKIGRRVT